MTEKLLKQMIGIVDANMEYYKSDFYKCDLKMLYNCEKLDKYDDPSVPEFWWEVNASHTHLLIIDEDNLRNVLNEIESCRFSFLRQPLSFVYGSFSYWTSNYAEYSKFYHYDQKSNELVEVTASEAKQQIEDVAAPIVGRLREEVVAKHPKEAELFNTHVPVKFASGNIYRRFVELVENHPDGKKLLTRVRQFRNYPRCAVNHYIQIANDFEKTDFVFSEMINDKCHLFGGIIYSKSSHDWFLHT